MRTLKESMSSCNTRRRCSRALSRSTKKKRRPEVKRESADVSWQISASCAWNHKTPSDPQAACDAPRASICKCDGLSSNAEQSCTSSHNASAVSRLALEENMRPRRISKCRCIPLANFFFTQTTQHVFMSIVLWRMAREATWSTALKKRKIYHVTYTCYAIDLQSTLTLMTNMLRVLYIFFCTTAHQKTLKIKLHYSWDHIRLADYRDKRAKF